MSARELKIYPETKFGGYTRYDGTVTFFSRVNALIQSAENIVDLGCGRGRRSEDPCQFRRSLQDLRGPGHHVLGVDVDAAAAVNPYLDDFRQIEDVAAWPIESGWADVVVSDYVLEHVEDAPLFFSEVNRILKPGGYVCFRTPNRWGYIAILSGMIPNRHHAKVVSHVQDGRQQEDVFPTFYRCNSRSSLKRSLEQANFDAVVYSVESEPHYASFSNAVYRVMAIAHLWLPATFRSTLFAFGQKNLDG